MRRFFFGLAVFALAAPLPLLAETTDRQIAKQIVKQLRSQKESGQLKGFNLDLQVEDGAVYLKGFVSEREQRRKAVDAARGVEGVKQVFNEIEIKPAEEAAEKTVVTRKQTEVKLETPPEPPSVNIEATEEDTKPVEATKLALGAVQTDPVVSSAPQNVFRTPQAIQVSNVQALKPQQTPARRTAREITSDIVSQYQAAMKRGELQGFGIDVKVDQGIVRLDGTVSNPGQLEYAIEVARDVAGVKKIVNALKVSNPGETLLVSHDGSDEGVQHAFRQESQSGRRDAEAERIAKEVVSGLQQQKEKGLLTNFGIDVQVDHRIVWMSGYVKNAEQHARALNVARYIRGVEKVVNDIKVQGQGTPLRRVNATLPQQGVPNAQPALNYRMVPIQPVQAIRTVNQTPMAFAPASHAMMQPGGQAGSPVPMTGNAGVGIAPARFDHPQMPGYAWPSYAPSPNYGAVTYPKQYSPSAWPYIGPFYPYPQVPLGWRRVTLEWDDGWWNLKFKNTRMH